MHDVSTRSTPQNIRELFIHLSDFHAYNTRFSCVDNLFVQKSRLYMKSVSLRLVRDYGAVYTGPDWRKLAKRAFKRKIHKLLLTVHEIEDYYVDAHSVHDIEFKHKN